MGLCSYPRARCTWSSSRDANTSYRVVNTLLGSLANETMLAIAKGLEPLTAGR
jgi:hypothetical protein